MLPPDPRRRLVELTATAVSFQLLAVLITTMLRVETGSSGWESNPLLAPWLEANPYAALTSYAAYAVVLLVAVWRAVKRWGNDLQRLLLALVYVLAVGNIWNGLNDLTVFLWVRGSNIPMEIVLMFESSRSLLMPVVLGLAVTVFAYGILKIGRGIHSKDVAPV